MGRNSAFLGVLSVLCLAGRAQAGPAEISDTARAVLEKAIESMGGDAALAKVKTMRLSGAGTWQAAGVPAPMPYTSEVVYAAPDRMAWKVEAPGMEMASAIHGDVGWSRMMAPPARIAGPMKTHMQEWLFTHAITLVRPLLHVDGIRITGGEAEKGDGKTIHRVNVEAPGGAKYVLTFVDDGRTFLAAYEGEMTNWDGRKAGLSMKLAEPKAFGDLTLPSSTEMQITIDGKVQETIKEQTSAIRWNPEVPDETFRMPDAGLVLMKASEKQTASAQCVRLLHKGPYSGMGDTIKKAMQVCQDVGLMAVGPVTTICLNDPASVKDESMLETEIAVPVMLMGPPPKLPEGASLKTFEAASVASMTAKGPYGDADVKALDALKAWIAEQGYEVTGAPRILYFHYPELFVAEDLVSEVQIPVRKRKM